MRPKNRKKFVFYEKLCLFKDVFTRLIYAIIERNCLIFSGEMLFFRETTFFSRKGFTVIMLSEGRYLKRRNCLFYEKNVVLHK